MQFATSHCNEALRSEESPQYPQWWQPLPESGGICPPSSTATCWYLLQGSGSHEPLWQRLFSCIFTRQQHPDGFTSVQIWAAEIAMSRVSQLRQSANQNAVYTADTEAVDMHMQPGRLRNAGDSAIRSVRLYGGPTGCQR